MGGLGLAGAAVLGTAGRAPAAPSGQYAVTTTPRPLTQPPDPFLGRMTPSADAATAGMFAPQVAWPLIAVHAALLPNGHLVTYGSPLGQAAQGGLSYDDWSPADGTGTGSHAQTPSMETYNSFCNGLQQLPDGRLVMVGGNSTTATMTYDPATGAEAMGQVLNRQRWYATVLRRPDDRILVLGGGDYYNTGAYLDPTNDAGVALTPEIGTGTGAWTLLSGVSSRTAFGAARNRWWYPRAYNAPDGRVFGMSDDQMWSLSDSGTGSIRSLGALPFAPGVSGSSVMFTSGRILVAGGGQAMNTQDVVATNAAAVVDISASTPRVTRTASMALRRNWLDLTVLANGEVLANGGTVTGTQGGAANSSYQLEIWNPGTGAWRRAASAARIRTYHSTAVLMQSGAVFTGGGGVPGPEDNLNAELYYPPYLFTRAADGTTRWADRQQLTSVAGSATYGGTLTLGLSDARTVASASLIRLGNVTHAVNADQRRVPLTVRQSGATLSVTLPTSRNVLPPGSYALQTVDGAGVPSPSQTLTISGTGAAGTVTVYAPAQTAGGGGTGTGTTPGTVPLTVGSVVGVEAGNFPGYLVRRQGGAVRLDPLSTASAPAARAEASWAVRAGLAGEGLSFESVSTRGVFLRAATGGLAAPAADDGSVAFDRAATFLPVAGLSGQGTSLQLYADRGAYLRHQDFVVRGAAFDGSDLGRADSSFRVKPALDPLVRGARVCLEVLAAPGRLLRHANYVLRTDAVSQASSALDRSDATFVVRAALDGSPGVSLEAVNFAGYYVRVDGARLVLQRGDGSAAFASTATFQAVTGLAATGVSLRSSADGPAVVSAAGASVSFGVPADTEAARTAATFVVRDGLA